jgi:hypothetical protein
MWTCSIFVEYKILHIPGDLKIFFIENFCFIKLYMITFIQWSSAILDLDVSRFYVPVMFNVSVNQYSKGPGISPYHHY